jgi:tRNA threonylcarbamoyladenosine biosynthesis protein TsaE
MQMNTDSQRFSTRLTLAGLDDTAALGARIASGLRPGDAVALGGDLGAGKTTLARAILGALGVDENMPSPTFTLVQTYETAAFPVQHFDLYRIEDPRELEELGLDESVDAGAALVEWPERAEGRLPGEVLYVSLTMIDVQSRIADVSGPVRWAPIFQDTRFVR